MTLEGGALMHEPRMSRPVAHVVITLAAIRKATPSNLVVYNW
jgi:hypothetical protein